MERGARISGSRFAYRMGPFALAELALYRFALDHLAAHGFVPVLPPVLVREEAMYGTGFLPTDEVNIYGIERDELYLTGTSEVALAGLHMGEILDAASCRCTTRATRCASGARRARPARTPGGCSACTSSTRSRCSSTASRSARRRSTSGFSRSRRSSSQALGIPYRVVNIAAGDLGSSAARKYDIEAWFPAQGRYREITSTSNTTDFQARRLDVRYRGEHGVRHLHTLNGTAVTARALLSVVENFQDGDGAVAVPEILQRHGAPARIEKRTA